MTIEIGLKEAALLRRILKATEPLLDFHDATIACRLVEQIGAKGDEEFQSTQYRPDHEVVEPVGVPPTQEEIRARLANRRAGGPDHPYSSTCACRNCHSTRRFREPFGSFAYWMEKENDYTDHDYLSGKDWERHDAALDMPADSKERALTLELLAEKRKSSLSAHAAINY